MPKPDRAARATLAYDADCSSCTKFAAMVRRLDRGKRIAYVSMYEKAVEARLRPLVGEGFDGSFHLELPDGTVKSGEAALEDLARLLPAAAPFAKLAFRVPGVRDVPAVIYRAFAAGRTCADDTAAKLSKD